MSPVNKLNLKMNYPMVALIGLLSLAIGLQSSMARAQSSPTAPAVPINASEALQNGSQPIPAGAGLQPGSTVIPTQNPSMANPALAPANLNGQPFDDENDFDPTDGQGPAFIPQNQLPPNNINLGTPTFPGSNNFGPGGKPQAPSNGGAKDFRPSVVEEYVPPSKKNEEYKAILKTSLGNITIKLFNTRVPKTVQNFIDLAEGNKEFVDVSSGKKVRRPFYNGLTFHRVLRNFLIQTGCPFGTGRGGPGYTIQDEFSPNLKHDRPGVVGMALSRSGRNIVQNSGASQFYITLSPRPELDGVFPVFGEVTSGMDVVKRIGTVATGPTDRPIRRVYLLGVEVIKPKEN